MRTFRLFAFAAILLAVSCWRDDKCPFGDDSSNDPKTILSITWGSLTQFQMSDVSRIDVTTEFGTEQCALVDCQTSIPYEFTTVDSVRVYLPSDRGSILLGPDDLTYSDNVIDITLNLFGWIFVPDRKTLESIGKSPGSVSDLYLQTADIDLSDSDWTPITPEWSTPFRGVYDGKGFAIRNMNVHIVNLTAASVQLGGFIGSNSGTIRNIRFEDCHVYVEARSEAYCAGVCAYNGGIVSACSFKGSLSAKCPSVLIGGVCGANFETIFMCSNSASVEAAATRDCRIGGVCGTNNGYIMSSFNTGAVLGEGSTVYCGGVSGWNTSSGILTACYSSGTAEVAFTQKSYFGAVCGANYTADDTISYCYWSGGDETPGPIGEDKGKTVGLIEFGDGTNGTGWPSSDLPGWGKEAPMGWDATTLGAWSNPWESLGGWNGGGSDTVYPTLNIPR